MISSGQIRAARSLLNVRQSDLARASGVSLATLNNVERGVGDPRTSTLRAIEAALGSAGIELIDDGARHGVVLQSVARPVSLQPYQASERILAALSPEALVRPSRVLFFVRRIQGAGASDGMDDAAYCVLLDSANRTQLFDRINLVLNTPAAAAEICGLLLAALSFYKQSSVYVDRMVDDTSGLAPDVAVDLLRALPNRPLDHPAHLFEVAGHWQTMLARYADRAGHPMHALVTAYGRLPEL